MGFLPGSVWNEMRREALDKLLEKRSEVRPHATQDITLPAYPAHTVGQVPALAARFANAAQCPADAVEKLKYLIFPIAEAESIPAAWRGKTLLELPRVMFGKLEQKTAARWMPCRTQALQVRSSTTPRSFALRTAGRCTAGLVLMSQTR